MYNAKSNLSLMFVTIETVVVITNKKNKKIVLVVINSAGKVNYVCIHEDSALQTK